MSRNSRWLRVLALALGLSLVAAACGGNDDDEQPSGGEDAGQDDGERSGGELVLGAEQWPECLNPITQCANASWMHYVANAHVLPRLMELSEDGSHVASPLIEGEPELAGDGIDDSGDPFTVTYQLNEDANWDDGTPITSADVAFTHDAYLDTTGTITTAGYDVIDDVDDSDPKTVVITFTEPYAAWPELFGGNSAYILKADAFESTDTADELITEIPFSGGPYMLTEFSATEALLTANMDYWDADRVPVNDTVRMVPLEDTDTQINALLAGEVMGIYPQPSPGINESLDADNIEVTFGAGTVYEGIWPDHDSLLDGSNNVLADVAVREAVFRAINRERIVEEVLRPISPDVEILNCGGWVPTVGEWCDNTDFADITYDPEAAAQVLEDAGWAKGSDGIYAKDGVRLSFTWQTVAGNARREAVQAIVIPELAAVGIEAKADNSDPGELFQQRLPQRQTELMLYAQVASPDPSVTTIFACENIPSAENDFAGQNANAWCNEEATALMKEADRTPDADERLTVTQQVGDMIRADFVWLPFYQLPLVTAVNTDLVSGPVAAYTSSPNGAFENIYDWEVVA